MTKMTRQEVEKYAMQSIGSQDYDTAEKLLLTLLENEKSAGSIKAKLGILYFHTKKYDLSNQMFAESIDENPKQPIYYLNYSIALMLQGKAKEMLPLLKTALTLDEKNHEVLVQLCWVYTRLKNYKELLSTALSALNFYPNEIGFLSSCNHSYYFLGDENNAIKYGKECLTYADQKSISSFKNNTSLENIYQEDAEEETLIPIKVMPIDGGKENIIAFSLWGHESIYCQNAIKNVSLAKTLYSNWTCRFYCDETLPENIIEQLHEAGAEIFIMPVSENKFFNYFWRFLVANDPKAKRFICRDADSLFSEREESAVVEWVNSGKSFHIMRDAVVHVPLILAGMWGGLCGELPNIYHLYKNHFSGAIQKNSDQHFLAELVWPLIKENCLIHDSHYDLFKSQPYPRPMPASIQDHIGAKQPLVV